MACGEAVKVQLVTAMPARRGVVLPYRGTRSSSITSTGPGGLGKYCAAAIDTRSSRDML